MIISAIVAASENRVIGRDNTLPWRLPDDLRYFRACTSGHAVIMGRKNYESGPFPLPNRTNIVLSRNPRLYLSGCHLAGDFDTALEIAKRYEKEEIFIIGGGVIYELAMSVLDKLYYTKVHAHVEGDVFFPTIKPSEWKLISEKYHEADEKHPYAFSFLVYERIRK